MKLSLNTYSIGQDFTLEDIIELLVRNGFDGVEFRCEANQRHGVEPETSKIIRRKIRSKLGEMGLEIACLSTDQRFDSPVPSVRRAAVDRVKRFIDLAEDVECGRVRTFGNDFPPGVPKSDVIRYVGESLRACGDYAENKGVDVLLEMHGDFNYWEYALGAVKIADHSNIAINYNCDTGDLVDGSVAPTFNHVKDYVRHVHLHDLENPGFPYKELLGLLKKMNYPNFCSLEINHREGGEKKVIALYAALFREMLAQV